MAVYLINIALIIFWRLHYNQNRVADSRKNYCTIVAIQWILISGLRGLDVGADTYAYYNVFENVKKYTRNGSIITFHDSLKSIDKLRNR